MRRVDLPIDPVIPEIAKELERARSVVIRAEPGAGKTTRVPPALLDAPFVRGREILVLEPRRLAAKTACWRVAGELGQQAGGLVGYQFRFENVTGRATRLRFLTEGMLMRRLMNDPLLKGVAAVVLDEFHERHIHTDVAISYLKRLQSGVRPDLRIVVMSATMDAGAVAAFLENCRVFDVPGRLHEVTVEYLQTAPVKRLEQLVCDAVRGLDGGGSALVFLPGMADIRRAEEALRASCSAGGYEILPLHGELSRAEQERAIQPPGAGGRKKIILSTNVAETSITIEGITAVIDSGLARVAGYSWWTGLPSLRTRPVSRASAVQRAGRAGRTGPGRCLRLYTRHDFETRMAFDVPEILRADLSQTVLELMALGVPAVDGLEWFERPPAPSLRAACELLHQLGATDESGGLSALGRAMSSMPSHPRLARMVLEGARRGVLEDAATAAALASEDALEGLDFLDAVRRAARLHGGVLKEKDRLERAARDWLSAAPPQKVTVLKNAGDHLAFSVLCGFPDRVAEKSAITVHRDAQGAFQALGHDLFVVVDAEETQHAGQSRQKTVVRSLCPVERDWLLDLEPCRVEEREELLWTGTRVESRRVILYGDLVLDEHFGRPGDEVKASQFMARQVLSAGLASVWDKDAVRSVESLRARFGFVRAEGADAVPVLDDAVVAVALENACAGKISVEELRGEDFGAHLACIVSHEAMRLVDRLAPAQVTLAHGRRVRVHYDGGHGPWIESRLQDFFGMREGPAVTSSRFICLPPTCAPCRSRVIWPVFGSAPIWKSGASFHADIPNTSGRRIQTRKPRRP